MEGRINQVWWTRYGQRYVIWFLACVVVICIVGILVVLVSYGIKTEGKQPSQNETPPPNLYIPPPPKNQPISYLEGRLNHTISPDGKYNLPIGFPFEINCTIFVNTEKPRQKADEISLQNVTSHKTLKYETCDLQPLGVLNNMWWCSCLFEMSAVEKTGTERLACCSSNWDSEECKNGYKFTLHFEVENVTMATTTRPTTQSTTSVTPDDRQTPHKLLPTKSQPQVSHNLNTAFIILIILVAVGGVAFGFIIIHFRKRSEDATCLSRLPCCGNPYQHQGDDHPPADDRDSDEDEEDLF